MLVSHEPAGSSRIGRMNLHRIEWSCLDGAKGGIGARGGIPVVSIVGAIAATEVLILPVSRKSVKAVNAVYQCGGLDPTLLRQIRERSAAPHVSALNPLRWGFAGGLITPAVTISRSALDNCPAWLRRHGLSTFLTGSADV